MCVSENTLHWDDAYRYHSLSLCVCRLEAAKDDYRIHCEELEKQLIEVQHRNDELTSLAEESRALKDELDILRCVYGAIPGRLYCSCAAWM